MPPPLSSPVGAQVPHAAELSRRNVAAVSHGKHVPMCTAAAALRIKAALSKVAWWPFDLESGVRVTWATSVPILVFLGLSVLELGPTYVTDIRRRQMRIIT